MIRTDILDKVQKQCGENISFFHYDIDDRR
jgi:hypothetical protein